MTSPLTPRRPLGFPGGGVAPLVQQLMSVKILARAFEWAGGAARARPRCRCAPPFVYYIYRIYCQIRCLSRSETTARPDLGEAGGAGGAAAGQVFNISNGDYLLWESVYPRVAAAPGGAGTPTPPCVFRSWVSVQNIEGGVRNSGWL